MNHATLLDREMQKIYFPIASVMIDPYDVEDRLKLMKCREEVGNASLMCTRHQVMNPVNSGTVPESPTFGL